MAINIVTEKSMQLRKRILEISQKVPALHIGGTFSSAEIIQVLYDKNFCD